MAATRGFVATFNPLAEASGGEPVRASS